jgi:tripartite-type tricarboxylate transporter receptor subunit TctC
MYQRRSSDGRSCEGAIIFAASSPVDMVHIPYKGTSLAMVDLLSGMSMLNFDSLSTALPPVKAAKLRALCRNWGAVY